MIWWMRTIFPDRCGKVICKILQGVPTIFGSAQGMNGHQIRTA